MGKKTFSSPSSTRKMDSLRVPLKKYIPIPELFGSGDLCVKAGKLLKHVS